jgi:hypothetical protein
MQRQMAVLATHGLTRPCCSAPDPVDVGERPQRERGVVLYGDFGR